MLDQRLWDVLACPSCGKPVEDAQSEAVCTGCGERYPIRNGQPNLHLRGPKEIDFRFALRPFGDDDPRYRVRPRPIPMNPNPVIDRDAFAYDDELWYGNGLTRELTGWLPGGTPDQILLDLGCGNRRVESVLRQTGMSYLGLDIAGSEPDVLGTAEALPVADASIDTVFTLGVMAHIQRPWLAVTEIARVLKPGGTWIGTVQFLEPCKMASRHHVSALGTLDWLEEGGFEIQHFEANEHWSGIKAMLWMGYYPRRPTWISRGVAAAVDGGHKLFRKVRPSPGAPLGEDVPESYTGGFRFVVTRPA